MNKIRDLLYWRRTKILATLGPATDSEKSIESLIKAGVNVFRLNMSHGSHEQHRASVKKIRKISKKLKSHTAILMDLCGPKIRVGKFKDGKITLKTRSQVVVSCTAKIGEEGLIVSQYKSLYKDVLKDDRVLLDDGNFELKVIAVKNKDVICEVVYGGELKDNKGMNLPDSSVSISSFTVKDKKDAELAIKEQVDFLALSFVREAKEVQSLNRFIKSRGSDIPVIAKIEKPEAIDNINEILCVSYGIMVARGDLGIELPAQKVPLIQKELINRARCFNRPVIVATQMLESMITNSRPTRAEVGDVANAALSSADAVMLSAETATGKYPLKAVRTMDGILREMEAHQWQHGRFGDADYDEHDSTQASERQAISHAVTSLSQELKLQGIIVPTRSGSTAITLSADRPTAPLVGVCTDENICCRLSLHWGVIPYHIEKQVIKDWGRVCKDISARTSLLKTGRRVLLVSGFHDDKKLNMPAMKMLSV